MGNQSLKKDDCNRIVNTDESRVNQNIGVRLESENGEIRDEKGVETIEELNQPQSTTAMNRGSKQLPDSVILEESKNGKDATVDLNETHQTSQKMNVNDKINGNSRIDNNKESVWKKNDLVMNMDNHGASSNVKSELGNSLLFVPTEIIGDDREVDVFDEELVELGSKNWVNTLCGYFVGYNMAISELRYNVRRMWSRCGLRDVLPYSNGVFLFKFAKNEEPSKLPLWVKLLNVQLEAWTHKGISALASGVGKPIIMDALTIEICHSGKGRMGFAMVLIEVDASKGFKKSIKVVYRNADKKETIVKHVSIEYSWKPEICKACGVFGHNDISCKSRQDTQNGKEHDEVNNGAEEKKPVNENEGFVEVQYKKKTQVNGNKKQQEVGGGKKFGFKDHEPKNTEKTKDKAKWSIKDDVLQAMKRSANKYVVLEVVSEQENVELNILKGRIEVDEYLNKRHHLPLSESENWSYDMLRYFKEKWEEHGVNKSNKERIEVEDVFEDTGSTAKIMTLNNLECLADEDLNKLANYVCDKEEFIPIVDQELKKEIVGCQMFKLVKKLKMLKPKLNALNWKNGNIFDKVVKLKDLVKEKQKILDKDPHNGPLKNDMVNTLNEYQDAMLDEEKLLF
ncbi:RNA-directed DNA polymerase, eukaryota, reverse transcriptase zinc-binding domain protein [Tanacetum coccineum]